MWCGGIGVGSKVGSSVKAILCGVQSAAENFMILLQRNHEMHTFRVQTKALSQGYIVS